jgi:hypothetical protein
MHPTKTTYVRFILTNEPLAPFRAKGSHKLDVQYGNYFDYAELKGELPADSLYTQVDFDGPRELAYNMMQVNNSISAQRVLRSNADFSEDKVARMQFRVIDVVESFIHLINETKKNPLDIVRRITGTDAYYTKLVNELTAIEKMSRGDRALIKHLWPAKESKLEVDLDDK